MISSTLLETHTPPPMDDKKNPLFNHQWQSLTQIASWRPHGGLFRFTEAKGIRDGEEKHI